METIFMLIFSEFANLIKNMVGLQLFRVRILTDDNTTVIGAFLLNLCNTVYSEILSHSIDICCMLILFPNKSFTLFILFFSNVTCICITDLYHLSIACNIGLYVSGVTVSEQCRIGLY